MPSSGLTSQSTSGDAPITLIPQSALSAGTWFNVTIINEGAVEGFYALVPNPTDTDWNRLTAAVSSVPGGKFLNNLRMTGANCVQVKRVASGADCTGLFASVE